MTRISTGTARLVITAVALGTMCGPSAWASPSPVWATRRVLADVPIRARAPFAALQAGQVHIGKRRYEVVVADSIPERREGLRGRQDPRPYQGMLFVFPRATRVRLTMAGVLGPLTVTFYRADGTAVGRRDMSPCAGTDATCPTYGVTKAFRYALETAPDTEVRGPLRVKTHSGGSGTRGATTP